MVTTVMGGEQERRTRGSLGTVALSLGSCVAGIPVKLHYTFFLLFLLEIVSSLLNISIDEETYPMYIVLIVILYGPVLLITILIHEFGHALMNKRLGGTVDEIVLWPLGGFAICGPVEALSGDLKVALAGPATHIPMVLLWWVIYLLTKGGEEGLWPSDTVYLDILSTSAGFFEMLSSQAVYMNIIIFCFNLLIPAYPLDGGRVYAACLMLVVKLKAQVAAKVTAITAMLITGGMILYAIISFFKTTYGNELFLGLVGVFVFYESYELWTAASRNELEGHLIFGRKCYQDADAPATDPAPTQNAETEIV